MKKSKVVLSLFVFFISVSFVLSGCSKNETKNQTNEVNNNQMMKDSGNMNSNNSMNSNGTMNQNNDLKDGSKNNDMMSKQESKDNSQKGDVTNINLPSMICNICKGKIEKDVRKVEGVISVKVDKETKTAHVNFDKSKTSLSAIESAITSGGYDANNKKRNMDAYENLPECCKETSDKK
ncbi:hypothetical protein BH10BAC5_BH10BAC5_02220 [soil metagenome]